MKKTRGMMYGWRGKLKLYAAAVALVIWGGCAAAPKRLIITGDTPPALAQAEETAVSPELEQEFDERERYSLAQDHFILARDYERRGMQEMADQLYQIAYDFWPQSHHLRKMLSDKFMRTETYDRALTLYIKDGEPLPNLTDDDKRAMSLIYLRLGNSVKAAEALESIGGGMNNEEMYSLALLYSAAGQRSRVLKVFREFARDSMRGAEVGARMAQMLIAERKFADAESLAVIMRAAYPNNAEAASLLGTVRYLSRDTASASALFRSALKLDSLNEEALRTLAHICIVREQFAEAAVYYKRLIAQGDIGRPYRRGLAILLFHLKEYGEAETMLDTLIKENNTQDLPGMQELHSYRGLIYTQTKRYGKAAEEFNAAIAVDPKYEDAWRELSYAYILAKDSVNARAAADRYVAAFPKSGTAWRICGYAHEMRKDYKEAAAAFRKAAKLDTADYFAWFQLGSALERQKLIDEAADAFRMVLRIRPGDADASNYLGYMWTEAGIKLDSAKTLIEDALKKEPQNGAFLDSYAWVFYKMGDYEKARHYMYKALEQEDIKSDPVPYEHLGDIYFKLENYRAAETAYKRSLELKTEEAERVNARLAEVRKILRDKGR